MTAPEHIIKQAIFVRDNYGVDSDALAIAAALDLAEYVLRAPTTGETAPAEHHWHGPYDDLGGQEQCCECDERRDPKGPSS